MNENLENQTEGVVTDQTMTFKVIDDEGKEIECETLFTFESDETGKNYIVYTDNTTDEEGNTKVYASIYNPDEDETKFPFSMQIEVIGFFVLSGEDRKAKIEDFKANAVAILFPYVRSLISSYTANANVPPLIIPPINVNRLLKSKKEE